MSKSDVKDLKSDQCTLLLQRPFKTIKTLERTKGPDFICGSVEVSDIDITFNNITAQNG